MAKKVVVSEHAEQVAVVSEHAEQVPAFSEEIDFSALEAEVNQYVVCRSPSGMGGSRLTDIRLSEAIAKYRDTELSDLFSKVYEVFVLMLTLIIKVSELRELQTELKTSDKINLRRASSQDAQNALSTIKSGVDFMWVFCEGHELTLVPSGVAEYVKARHAEQALKVKNKEPNAKLFPLYIYVLELLEQGYDSAKATIEAERALANGAYLDLASVMKGMPWALLPRGFTQAKNDRHITLKEWAENKLATLQSEGDVDTTDGPNFGSYDDDEDDDKGKARKPKVPVVDDAELAELDALL